MYSVLNTLSEYTCLYISKNITSCIFLLVFEIFEYLQCILKFVLIIFYKVIFKKIWKELLNTSKTTRTDVFLSNVCTYTIQLKVLFIWKIYATISLPFEFFFTLQLSFSGEERNTCLIQTIVPTNLCLYCKQKKNKFKRKFKGILI